MKELLFFIVLFTIGILLVSLLYMNNTILTVLLLLIVVFVLKFWHRKDDIYFFVFGAIFGLIAEVVGVHFGGWQYTNPSILGVPTWVPVGWGLTLVLTKRITEVFVKIQSA